MKQRRRNGFAQRRRRRNQHFKTPGENIRPETPGKQKPETTLRVMGAPESQGRSIILGGITLSNTSHACVNCKEKFNVSARQKVRAALHNQGEHKLCYGCTDAVKEAKAAAAVKALAERKLAAEQAAIVKPPESKEGPPQGHGGTTGPGAKTPAPTTDVGGGGTPSGENERPLGHGGAAGPGAKTPAPTTSRGGGGGSPSGEHKNPAPTTGRGPGFGRLTNSRSGGWSSPLVPKVPCYTTGCQGWYGKAAFCVYCLVPHPGAWACIGCDGIRGGTLDECPWRRCPIDGRPRGLKRTSPLATLELVRVFRRATHDNAHVGPGDSQSDSESD